MTSIGMCCYCINSTDKNKTSHDLRDPSWNLSKSSSNIIKSNFNPTKYSKFLHSLRNNQTMFYFLVSRQNIAEYSVYKHMYELQR